MTGYILKVFALGYYVDKQNNFSMKSGFCSRKNCILEYYFYLMCEKYERYSRIFKHMRETE